MSQPNSAAEPRLVGRQGESLAGDDLEVLDFTQAIETLAGLNGRYGVRINPGEDARALIPYTDHIARFEVAFPGYRDGRGYSTARILREAGYTGAIRAVGDVLRDQVLLMLRCGFDEFLLKDRDPSEAMRQAAARFTTVYQSAADALEPAWALRRKASA